MDRDEQARLLTGAGILAVIAGLIFFFKKRGGHSSRPHFASITVLSNGTDVDYSPETIKGVSRGRGDTVVWRITNESGREVEVCVGGFKNESTGVDDEDDPLMGDKCRRVRPGHQSTLPRRVRRDANCGTYKYSIYLDGREAKDPRLAIVD